MSSLELSLQIRPEFVNQVVNHTNWDSCRYPPERRRNPAICCRIIGIRETTGGDCAQQSRPVKRAPSQVFPCHHRSNYCLLQTVLNGTRTQAEITRVLMKERSKQKGSEEACRRGIGQSSSQPLAVPFCALPISGQLVVRLLYARGACRVGDGRWIGSVSHEEPKLLRRAHRYWRFAIGDLVGRYDPEQARMFFWKPRTLCGHHLSWYGFYWFCLLRPF